MDIIQRVDSFFEDDGEEIEDKDPEEYFDFI